MFFATRFVVSGGRGLGFYLPSPNLTGPLTSIDRGDVLLLLVASVCCDEAWYYVWRHSVLSRDFESTPGRVICQPRSSLITRGVTIRS